MRLCLFLSYLFFPCKIKVYTVNWHKLNSAAANILLLRIEFSFLWIPKQMTEMREQWFQCMVEYVIMRFVTEYLVMNATSSCKKRSSREICCSDINDCVALIKLMSVLLGARWKAQTANFSSNNGMML